jgi:AcrR family transcriptional regulator
MSEIDEQIILTAIQVAGASEANRFSTKEIAARLGISEFMIYDHFHDKDNLLNKCDERCAADYYSSILKWMPLSKSFLEFFNHVMDDHLQRTGFGAFAINYCRVFPRFEKASDFAYFKANVEATIDAVLVYFPLAHREDAFALWCYFTREFTCDGQLLIEKRIADTPKNRALMAELILNGFTPYLTR